MIIEKFSIIKVMIYIFSTINVVLGRKIVALLQNTLINVTLVPYKRAIFYKVECRSIEKLILVRHS